jgi:hypothetical protein
LSFSCFYDLYGSFRYFAVLGTLSGGAAVVFTFGFLIFGIRLYCRVRSLDTTGRKSATGLRVLVLAGSTTVALAIRTSLITYLGGSGDFR